MRDYKNVKVPKKYRTVSNRATVTRATTGRISSSRSSKPGGIFVKIMIAFVIAAGSYLGWEAYSILTRADIFQIAGVDVTGVRHLTENDLKGIAGVFTGQNIFRADLDTAANRARSLPWVSEARIHRNLPNRIRLAITERNPAAVLDTGTAKYLIDENGVTIERLTKDNASALSFPSILIKGVKAAPGRQITSAGLGESLSLLSELSNMGGWKLSDVTIKGDSAENLTVVYAGNEFRIGQGNYAEKLRRLSEVTADLKRRGVNSAYIDLRPERQVAVMVKKDSVRGPGARGQ